MDRGAWWAVVHRVAQGQTWLKRLSMHACIEEGNGNPLQYSCLGNPRDSRAWWAAVYVIAQSRTRLKQLSSSSSNMYIITSLYSKDELGLLSIETKQCYILFIAMLWKIIYRTLTDFLGFAEEIHEGIEGIRETIIGHLSGDVKWQIHLIYTLKSTFSY